MRVFHFFTITILATVVWSNSIEEESQLQDDLLSGYKSNVRPARQVQVNVGLVIQNILSLDIVEQTLAVTGNLVVTWDDARLSWDESQSGNVTNVYFKSDQIWRPTLVLQNSAAAIEVLGDNGNQKSIPLEVNNKGGVLWLAPVHFISYCAVDVSKFPFDTQTCELIISGWMYSTESVKLTNLGRNIILNQFNENGEYDIKVTYTRVDVHTRRRADRDILVFGLELKRKYSYYMMNVVLPVLLMQLLGLVVFVVPAESGEKLTFSLTILLSLAVMMTLVAEQIPTTSLQISAISIYTLGGTVISSLEVVMTVIILDLKHQNKESVHLTKKMQVLANVLVVLACWKKNKMCSTNAKPKESSNIKLATTDDTMREEDCNEISTSDKHEPLYASTMTYEDICKMMDRFCLLFFTFATVVFIVTLVLLVVL